MPCNFHLRALAAKVKEGIREAGGTPMEFNTIAISDGITMGTEGMKASLVSREVIADSIELVASAHAFDAVIAISGCDKTIPGTVMALCRLNVPSLMLYGGSIYPGHYNGERITIQEVFEAIGAHAAGRITDDELTAIEDAASPGAGACGGQFTANTMAMAFEVLGISPTSSGVPADGPAQGRGGQGGRPARDGRPEARPAAERHHHPRSLENAIAAIACSGGSTNGVLHLLAVAKEMGVELYDRRLRPDQRAHAAAVRPEAERPVRRARPVRRRRRPGRAEAAQGGRASCTRTPRRSPARPSASTPTKRRRPTGSRWSGRSSDPLKTTGGLVILNGNLAPEGCVVKVAGYERRKQTGPGAGVRVRRGRDGRGRARRASRPATSS